MNAWTLFVILLSTFPAWSSVSRRSSATFSYNQNRRHDYFHDSQDGSHGSNYQYGNPESDVQVGVTNHPSYHGGNHLQPSYNERHPEPNRDSEWSSSESLLSFDRPRNVNPMGLPPVYTPNPIGGVDTKLQIDQRSPWYNAGHNGRPGQGPPEDPKNPKIIEDVGGHVFTIPQFPLVDAKAASMKYSNQNNDELFKNLYATHPDIVRYVNPPSGPINVLGLPHNLRFQNPLGSVNGFRPPEYETNKKLPTPVVDTGVRKGSGYIDDDQKFHRIYDYHPHIHGYVNPEKNAPINVFGVPPNLRFPHPNGQVDGFRPPEVETNKFLTGPADDHVQPIGERPILLRYKDNSASISAHPSTVHLEKNKNRAIYQSSQSQHREHVLHPNFMNFQHQQHFWDHDQEPLPSASGKNEFVVNKPGAELREYRPVEKSKNFHRPGKENVYNPKQRLHALSVQQQQELAEVNYADKQKNQQASYTNDQKPLEEYKTSQQPYAQYSQGPIRYVYPRSRVSSEENFKYFIAPTTYRPPFFKGIGTDVKNAQRDFGNPSRNQNFAQPQRYNQMVNDQKHSRFSYHGEDNSGINYANSNDQALSGRTQMPGYLNEPSRSALSNNNLNLRNSGSRSDLRNSQEVPAQRAEKVFSQEQHDSQEYDGNNQQSEPLQGGQENNDNSQPASFENPSTQSSFEQNEFQKENSKEQSGTPKVNPTHITTSEEHHFIYKRPPLDHSKIETEIKIKIQHQQVNPQLNKNYDQYDKDFRYYDSSYPIGEQLNVLKYDGVSNTARAGNIFVSNDSRPNSSNQINIVHQKTDGHREDGGTFRYSPTTEYASYQQAPTRHGDRYKGDTGDFISNSYQVPSQPSNVYEGRNNGGDGRGGQRDSYGNAGFSYSSPNNIQPQPRDSYNGPIRDSYNGPRDWNGNIGIAYSVPHDKQPRYGGSYNGHQDSYRNTGTLYRNNQKHDNSYNRNQGSFENSAISYASSNQYRPRHGGSNDVQRNNYRNSYGNSGFSRSTPYQYQPKIMHDHGGYDSYGYTNQGNNAGYGRDTYNGPSGDYGHQYGNSYYGQDHPSRHGRPYDDNYHYKPKTILGHILPKLIKYAYGIGMGMTKEITFHQPDYGYLNYPYAHGYQNRHGYGNQGYNNPVYVNHGYTHPTKGITIKLGLRNLLNKAFDFLHKK